MRFFKIFFSSIFFTLFFLTVELFAEDDQISYVTSERDSLAIVDGLVNVCNGKLIQIDKDIEIQGSSPLELIRYYDGGHHFESDFGYGIGISLPIQIKYYSLLDEENLFLEQRTGSFIPCDAKSGARHTTGAVSKEFISSSYTNYTESVLRGEPPLTALSLKCQLSESTIKLGDGTIRYYDLYDCKRFFELQRAGASAKRQPVYQRLTSEKLPNGNVRHIKYCNNDPTLPSRIYTKNSDGSLELNSIDLSYKFIRNGEDNKKEFLVNMKASNGQQVSYFTKKERGKEIKGDKKHYYLLKKVLGDHLPTSQYSSLMRTKRQSSLFSFNNIKRPDGRFLEVEYDEKERVKNLFQSGISTPLYTFSYSSKYKLVTNGLGAVKRYQFSKNRLINVDDENCSQGFVWDKKGQLKAHIVTDNDGVELSKKAYTYNSKGYITESKLYANIKAVGSKDEYTTKFTYSNDHFNLVLSKLCNDKKKITYRYKPETNLLEEKLVIVDDKIVEREFYTYDKNAILIKKITDDGDDNSFRLITTIEPQLDQNLPGMTMPHLTREYCSDPSSNQPIFLKMTEAIYALGDLLSEERTFDNSGTYRYSRFFYYNSKSQLIKETNPIGEETIYAYDDNGNKIFEENIGSGKKLIFEYDTANRLVLEYEQHSDETKFEKTYAYDAMGNCTSSIDEFGQTTFFTFDKNSRETDRTDPFGQIEYKEYDALNRITAHTDKDGYRTETISNIYGKPLEIKYPDGTSKKFAYNLEGHLTQEIEIDGTTNLYHLDYQGRVTAKKTYCPQGNFIKFLQYTYKGPNLTSETDTMGNITYYSYDEAGRKISQTKGGVSTYYEYDNLGRPYKIKCSDRVDIKEYDLLDRVIETRVEDNASKVYQKTECSYDIFGNVISERIFSDQDIYSEYIKLYNSRNLLILQIDPLGNVTKMTYDYSNHLEKETIDPLGRKKKEIFDPLQRLLAVHIYDSNDNELSHSSFGYDNRGNQILRHEESLFQGLNFGIYAISYDYDCMGQKTSEVEQDIKKTSYTYNFGKLSTITKPDGVILYHTYDPLGRLSKLESSEGSIRYIYQYDPNDNLLNAEDVINKTVTWRSYDTLNRLVYEKQATGIEFHYSYDDFDRIKEISFFDGKLIYNYSSDALISIEREKNNQTIYSYQRETDWCGKTIFESLPNNYALSYYWDSLGRCREINSNYFNQSFQYDSVSNLIYSSVQDPIGNYSSNFAYDDLNQIKQESGLFENKYAFDSNNNRREKNGSKYSIDGLNQLTDDELSVYTYDKNGNRTSKGSDRYSYDAMGRLISFNNTRYCYDPLGRRTDRIDQNSTQYFYLLDTEIGFCQNGSLREFRAVYNKYKTVSIELDGEVYSPIRNHRGDICSLLDDAQIPQVTYRYDAFGEFTYQGSISSPWRMFGQRYDESTKLYHFDKREYDSSIGRWLTPDPLGFADGPNLYGYVKNNPLTFVDPYGLWREEAKDFFNGAGRSFVDDASFGATEKMLGKYEYKSIYSKTGCVVGVGGSLAVGLWLGTTEVKAAQGIVKYGWRFLNAGYRTYKNLSESRITPIAKDSSPTVAKVSDVARRSGVEAPKGRVENNLLDVINTNPFKNKVTKDVFISDVKGNIITVPKGNRLTGSTDGKWIQLREYDGTPTGLRLDGPHSPYSHSNPQALQGHAHVPGVKNIDGTPWLKINH